MIMENLFVGVVIAIMQGFFDESQFEASLNAANTIETPKAPGFPLLLDLVSYNEYCRFNTVIAII